MTAPLRMDLLSLALAYALAAASYGPRLDAPPVHDDRAGVLLNAKTELPRELLKGFFRPNPAAPPGTPVPWYAYRPLTEATFLVNLGIAHSMRSLRAGSLLVHFAATALVLILVRRLAPERPAAARWAALFFAVHPMAVQAVFYVYQRATALEALLAFLCIALHLAGRRAAALLAGLAACAAKETAVTLPVVILALEWILRDPAEPGRRALRRAAPYALLALLPAGMAAWSLAEKRAAEVGGLPYYGFPPLEYLLVELRVVVRYLGLCAWPFPLRFLWDRVVPMPGAPAPVPLLQTAACGIALVSGAAWISLGPVRHRLPRLALALFLAPLALESSVIPIPDVAWCYRCYPSLLGAGLAFGLAASRVPAALGASAVLLLAVGAGGECRAWSDLGGLLRRDVRHAFHLSVSWTNVACDDHDKGWPAPAEKLLRQASRSAWQDERTCDMRVAVLEALGRREEADAARTALRRRYGGHPFAVWRDVQAAFRAGDEAALAGLEREACSLAVMTPELAQWVSERRIARREWDGAEAILKRHLERYPSAPLLWDHLGHALSSQGRLAEAEAAYRRAIALTPAIPKAHLNLGFLLYRRGELDGAEAAFREALRWDPAYALARKNLEVVLSRKRAARP